MKSYRKPLVALVAFVGLAAPLVAQEKAAFKKDGEIVLEGDPFFDYVLVDSDAKRLYVAHSPNVDVVDLEKRTRVGVIEGVNGAHGIAVVPALKRGYATSGKKNKVIVFDLGTLKATGEIKTGGKPDAIKYVTSAKEIWSMNGQSGDITCADAQSLEVKATVKLPAGPESCAEYLEKGLVFVNIEDKDCVCAVDIKKHEVVATYPLAPGKTPTGLAIDEKNGLLFAGCSEKLVVLDANTGKVVTSFDIPKGCDAAAFDPGTGNAFASCGDGKTAVVHVKDAKTVESKGTIETESGARTCTVDPVTHKVYVCTGPRKGDKGAVKVLIFSPAP